MLENHVVVAWSQGWNEWTITCELQASTRITTPKGGGLWLTSSWSGPKKHSRTWIEETNIYPKIKLTMAIILYIILLLHKTRHIWWAYMPISKHPYQIQFSHGYIHAFAQHTMPIRCQFKLHILTITTTLTYRNTQ